MKLMSNLIAVIVKSIALYVDAQKNSWKPVTKLEDEISMTKMACKDATHLWRVLEGVAVE